MNVLTIELNTETLLQEIDREVSKVAARTRNDGVSVYDVLKIYTSDAPLVQNALDASIRNIVGQFPDVATEGDDAIIFQLPDFDENNEATLNNEINRYLAVRTVADWFLTRLPDISQYFSGLTSESMARIITLVRHRKRVKR